MCDIIMEPYNRIIVGKYHISTDIEKELVSSGRHNTIKQGE